MENQRYTQEQLTMHGNISGEAEAKDAWKDVTPPPKVDLSYSSKTDKTITVNTSTTGTDVASGIAKYIFEYKKGTETNWQNSTEGTSLPTSYTYTGLASETAYNFRVTVSDNAGNTNSTGTNVNQTTNEWTFQDEDVGKKVNYTPKAGQSYNTQRPTSEAANTRAADSPGMFFACGTYTDQHFSTSDLKP